MLSVSPLAATPSCVLFTFVECWWWWPGALQRHVGAAPTELSPCLLPPQRLQALNMFWQSGLAPDETVVLLHPPLPVAGVSTVMERERQQNDSLVRGYLAEWPRVGSVRTFPIPDVYSPIRNPSAVVSIPANPCSDSVAVCTKYVLNSKQCAFLSAECSFRWCGSRKKRQLAAGPVRVVLVDAVRAHFVHEDRASPCFVLGNHFDGAGVVIHLRGVQPEGKW